MSDNLPRLDLRSVYGVIRRRAFAIAACVALTFVVVYALSDLQTPVYSAVSEVQFSGSTAPVLQDEEDARDPETFNPGNEIYLITSSQVRQVVNQALGPADAAEVRQVGVVQLDGTDILRISVSSTSPEVAKEAADLYAETYVALRQDDLKQGYEAQIQRLEAQVQRYTDQIAELDQQIATATSDSEREVDRALRATLIGVQSELLRQIGDLQLEAESQSTAVFVAKEASVPSLPDSPTPLRDAGVAAVVALVIALGVTFLVAQLDTRLASREAIGEASAGLSILGSLPETRPQRSWVARVLRRGNTATGQRELVDPTSAASEAYRALATSLRFSDLRSEKRRLLVTSSLPGEGKTTVTGNLAAVLAENGLKVVVVSADLRRPQLGEMLGVDDLGPGLSSVMLGDEKLRDVLATVTVSFGVTFTVLPSGALPHEPSVLLGSDEFGDILDQFEKAGADFILIDCAPVLPVSDPLAAARHVDGVLMTVLHGKTRRAELAAAVERLTKVDAEIVGIVVNGVASRDGDVYANQYGYASSEA
jgi:capsular exopolysaccharide synthesis family protein